MKFMDKLAAGLEKFLMPVAEKLGSNKPLCALRDGFIATLPLSMAGSVGTLLLNVLLKPDSLFGKELMKIGVYKDSIFPILEKYLNPALNAMWWATLGLTTIFLVITISYSLARAYEVDPLAGCLVALASFLALIPDAQNVTLEPEGAAAVTGSAWGMLTWNNFNSGAMFTGMLVALVATQLFIIFTKAGWTIRMPEQVPPAVSRAFSAVIPAVVTIFIFGIIYVIFMNVIGMEFKQVIEKMIQTPLMNLGQSPITYIVIITISQLLWFFGLHGLNMVDPVLKTMYDPALNKNIEILQTNGNKAEMLTLTRNFVDVYAMPGGSGGTLALIIAIFIFSKKQESRELAKLAIAPGAFNINEPVIFGLPLVLNPIYFIPFLITPGILLGIAYFFTETIPFAGKLCASAPWVTPPVFSAFLATNGDIKACILAAGLLVLAIVIWAPFVIAANRMGTEE